jgi:hypothetical protein
MSKARLLADLMRDSKISLAEVSGGASASDFNTGHADYNSIDSLNQKVSAMETERATVGQSLAFSVSLG